MPNKTMSEDELYNELKQWFDEKWGKEKTMSRSKVAQLIKNRLEKTGNYKNAPRGNPRKGNRAMQDELRKRNWGE